VHHRNRVGANRRAVCKGVEKAVAFLKKSSAKNFFYAGAVPVARL